LESKAPCVNKRVTIESLTMDGTTLANMIQDVWSEKTNNFFKANQVVSSFFLDFSDEFQRQGFGTLEIPNITEMTANAKTNATVVLANANTDTKVTLTVNTWYECSFIIEKREAARVKQSYGIQEMYMKNAAYTVLNKLEIALIDLFAGFAQTTGASNQSIADSNIRRAIQYLDDANCPQEDRAFFLTPKAVWVDLMSLDKFTLNTNSSIMDPVTKGPMRYLYGYPIRMTSLITTAGASLGSTKNCFAHKTALAWASSKLDVQSNYIPEYLSVLTTADLIYGVIENRDTSGCWIKSS
jgi:hypothetical protein